MKTKLIALCLLAFGTAFTSEEKSKAPNGGRIIDTVTPNAEFLINKDKKIEIRFLEDGKVIAPATQTVTVTMGDRAKPTKLTFEKDGDKLISDKEIPEGKDHPVVLQIKSTPDEKAVTTKFTLNLAKCPSCENAEYACVCSHEDKEHGHTHKPGEEH
jgi:hypothetical protein